MSLPEYAPDFCPRCGSELVVRYNENRERCFCQDCNDFVYMNPNPCASVAVIKDDEVLMVKRDVEPGKGTWSLPGGFLEYDEEPKKAASRELKEETSVEIEEDILELLETFLIRHENYQNAVILIYKLEISETEMELSSGEDVQESRFMSSEDLEEKTFSNPKYKDVASNLID